MGIHPQINLVSDVVELHTHTHTLSLLQPHSPLLPPSRRPRFALLRLDGVQHNLDGVLRRVVLVPLAPIVRDRIRKDAARLVECGRDDRAADGRVALEAVFGILVPEVEGAVRAGCAEGAVGGVEGDVVDGVDGDDIVGRGVAVALEREVGAARVSVIVEMIKTRAEGRGGKGRQNTHPLSLSSTY